MSSKTAECSTSYSHSINTVSTNVTELTTKQIERLRSVLSQNVEIHGGNCLPTLEIQLSDLIGLVRKELCNAGLKLRCVKLNGGAATHCLANEQFNYTDVDLIFPISLANEDDFDKVRNAVFDVLFSLMPIATTRTSTCADAIRDTYISKMVKVCSEDDRWSLFSLHNDYGKCIELKFVDRMRRQFEFSVDSFQITLDRLLDNQEKTDAKPKVFAESVYGDIRQALSHLNNYMIDTRNPEEIRGGGLLKYCHLISRGYNATQNCQNMEKYMCSRFFIDFSDIHTQEMKLHQYLENHFGSEDQMKLHYLQILYKVIKESTICLMGHERRQTLNMVDRLRMNLEYGMMYLNVACSGDESSTASGMSSPAPPSTVSSDSSIASSTSNNNGGGQIVQGGGTFATSPGRSTLLYLAPNSHYWIPVV
jgi:hypothetical protein